MIEPLPTYFISHGGGPSPWMPNLRAMFSTLELSLKEMVESWHPFHYLPDKGTLQNLGVCRC